MHIIINSYFEKVIFFVFQISTNQPAPPPSTTVKLQGTPRKNNRHDSEANLSILSIMTLEPILFNSSMNYIV